MERKPSVGKRLALGCGVLIGLLVVLGAVAYFVLQAIGGRQVRTALARVKASGAPITWEEAIPPPVPDDQNAAVLYEKAFAAMALTRTSRETLRSYISARTRAERESLATDIQHIVAANAQALSYVAEAAKRPKCRFNRDWRDPYRMRAPEPAKLRDLSTLACARAVLQADRGQGGEALRTWSLNFAIVDHLGSDCWLMSQLTRYGMLAFPAGVSLQCMLETCELSEDQCLRLARPLGEIEIRRAFVKSLEVERTTNLWVLDLVRQNPNYLASMTPFAPREPPNPGAALLRRLAWLRYRAISPLDETAMLGFWEKQIALARKPYRLVEGELRVLDGDAPRYAPVTRALSVVLARPMMARDSALARVALMRTALGLAAQRTRFGRYPDSLDQLRKALRWEVPGDPFSGNDFTYRREGDGYLLYSVGPDLQDDDGTPWDSDREDGDIVWRMER